MVFLYPYSSPITLWSGNFFFISFLINFSTIGDEKNNNPRLQVDNVDQYIEIMNNLKLANPKMMDVAVPANLKGVTLNQL